MKTWEDLKKKIREQGGTANEDLEEMEALAVIIGAIINKRNELGYTQRQLAEICGLPHSSIARIEACNVKPNVTTLLKIMKPLGLTLNVSSI